MNITVYLGANEGNDPSLRKAVRELGTWIGESGNRLVYGGSKSGLMGEIDKWFEGTGHAPVIRGRIAHMMNAYELSLHGVGISIYPASISSLIRDKDVCVREVEHPDAHASYALIWNKNHTLSHVAEEFIAYVKEESGQQVYYA